MATDKERATAVLQGSLPRWRKVLRLLELGWTKREIEERIECPDKLVYQVRRALENEEYRKAVAALYASGLSQKAVCRKIGCAPITVMTSIHLEGVPARGAQQVIVIEDVDVQNYMDRTYSGQELAEMYGIDLATLLNAVERQGGKRHPVGRPKNAA